MKHLLVVPLIVLAGTAGAQDTSYSAEATYSIDPINGDTLARTSASVAYLWNDTIAAQADFGLTRFSDGAAADRSLGAHVSYFLSPGFRVGGYLGWETIDGEASDFLYQGVEFEIIGGDGTSISVFGGRNGDNGFPASGNDEYGATIRIDATDDITLVGRGLLRDNDGIDRFTQIVGAGMEYDVNPGLAVTGEVIVWDRAQGGSGLDDGYSIALGARLSVDEIGLLLRPRDSITNTFGSEFNDP